MGNSLIWISGASGGIGRAMAETVPWDGARVIGISRRAAPGAEHQEQLRQTSEDDFPKRQKFLDLHEEGKLTDPREVAASIWGLLDRGLDNGSVVDLRELASTGG